MEADQSGLQVRAYGGICSSFWNLWLLLEYIWLVPGGRWEKGQGLNVHSISSYLSISLVLFVMQFIYACLISSLFSLPVLPVCCTLFRLSPYELCASLPLPSDSVFLPYIPVFTHETLLHHLSQYSLKRSREKYDFVGGLSVFVKLCVCWLYRVKDSLIFTVLLSAGFNHSVKWKSSLHSFNLKFIPLGLTFGSYGVWLCILSPC